MHQVAGFLCSRLKMIETNAPFNLSCVVTTLNVFSVSRITIPEQPTILEFLALRTVYIVKILKIIYTCFVYTPETRLP
jgi:hypothetical protein